MEKKIETTIMGLYRVQGFGGLGFRVLGAQGSGASLAWAGCSCECVMGVCLHLGLGLMWVFA